MRRDICIEIVAASTRQPVSSIPSRLRKCRHVAETVAAFANYSSIFLLPARKIIREKSRRHGKVRCGRATFFLQPSVSKWEYTVATEAIDPLLYFS